MFGLTIEKQWFPFKFLTNNGLDYVGDWPAIEQYSVKKEEMKDFKEYYEKTKAEYPVFSMENMLVAYCKVDTKVLYEACAKFYQLSYKIEKINPLQSISISSLSAKVYTARHIPDGCRIAVIYDTDCAAVWKNMQSEIANCYLSYIQETQYPDLCYAGNRAREYRIAGYLVDGFSKQQNTIIEVSHKPMPKPKYASAASHPSSYILV